MARKMGGRAHAGCKSDRYDRRARTIERMRRMNGSGISPQESPGILRCLVFRSFGRPGLDFLDRR